MNKVKVKVVKSQFTDDLPLPNYQTSGSAGVDLRSVIDTMIGPGDRMLIKTGLSMEIPVGYEAQIRPRSGLAFNYGVTVINSPGTIDSDYRGEIGVVLINHGLEPVEINRGDRIAQMVVAPVVQCEFEQVDILNSTERGNGGFGSTGV